MIEDLTLQQADELIEMIGIIHKSAHNTIVPILEKIKKNPTYKLNPDELETLKTWYSKPEDTKLDDNHKVAKTFTYVVLKKLNCEYLIK